MDDIVTMLQRLLAEAERGELTGLAVVAGYGGRITTEWRGSTFNLITGAVVLQVRMANGAMEQEPRESALGGGGRQWFGGRRNS